MSEYNNNSNDELPFEGEVEEYSQPNQESYADEQYAEGEQTYTEQAYTEENYTENPTAEQAYATEEYAEPENNYYTTEYEQTAEPAAEQAYEQVQPTIFTDQVADDLGATSDAYSTELPSYNTEPLPYEAPTEYVEQPIYEQQQPEYAEPIQYTEQAYTNEPVYAEEEPYAPTEQYQDSEGYVAAEAYVEPEPYDEQNYTEQQYAEQGYAQPDYNNAPDFNQTLDAQNQAGFVAGAAAQPIGTDGYGNPNDGYVETGYAAPAGEQAYLGTEQQDFRQEYSQEPAAKRAFPTGWMVTGLSLILVMMVGFYYLYANFVDFGGTTNVPIVNADKTPIKTFPNGGDGTAVANNNTKTTDRIQNNSTTVATGEAVTSQTLKNSREEVIDQPTKSEDRVDISDNIVADNDDRDIQNVLTLIKSSANNVEILLKPDDVSLLDQNQISVDGLETILVDATPVRLDDLIRAANQQPESAIEQVPTANVDDLPIVAEGNQSPFSDITSNGNAASTELPETNITPTTAIAALPEAAPLPETDLSNAISIASNQAVEPINIVQTAPKPITRPAIPATVPNSLAPQLASTSGGAYGVQLVALPSEASARQAFAKFSSQHSNILGGYQAIIREVNIPGKGIFFRLFAGPFSNYNDANQVCANLRAAGGDCLAKKM